MTFIAEIATTLWSVWKEMFAKFIEITPKIISFFLWVITALVVLPCVFVAGEIYPRWVKWGEGL